MNKSSRRRLRRRAHRTLPAYAGRTLSGIVQELTFRNEQTGFFVARVRLRGVRDAQNVVGAANSISVGERLEARGHWEVSPNYGRQFKANDVSLSLPADESGLVKFMAMTLPGIGVGLATKLVEAFGNKVSWVVEHHPERVAQVPGIGPKRAARMIEMWQERAANHRVLAWLSGLGMSAAAADAIVRRYGNETQAQVTDNPYGVAETIHGVGFKKADAMAKKIGIAPAHPARIQAGLRHVLREATDSGSCGLPRQQVREQTRALLKFELDGVDLIDHEITRLLERGLLINAPAGGAECLFLAKIYRQEVEIAKSVVDRLHTKLSKPIRVPEAALTQALASLGIQLEPSQRAAVELALREPVSIITGGPGTGKTTITRAIVQTLMKGGLHVCVCAPTGKAAKRAAESIGIEARTIHRMLEVRRGRFVHNLQNPLQCDALIVDELSMVDVPLFRALLHGLARCARLILVGDMDQLPSVGPGKVLADLIASGVVPTARLTEVFRQARQSDIIVNAHRVNGGQMPILNNTESGDFRFLSYLDDSEAQAALLRTITVMKQPGRFLPNRHYDPLRDVQVLSPMRRGTLGVDELNKVLRRGLNPHPSKEMPFRDGFLGVGDKVIQTKNNYTKAIFNGEIGYVSDLDPITRAVSVDFDGRRVDYAASDLAQLRLAYALTIHRSQGSEFPVVLLAISYGHYPMLKRNLLYTGITRARELLLIFGNPRAAAHATHNSQVEERYSKLRDWLRAEARTPATAAAV